MAIAPSLIIHKLVVTKTCYTKDMKDIPGYENKYGVERDGRVWSYHSQRYLKPWLNRQGYHRVALGNKSFGVHRLVAITYIPNPENKRDVNHKDHNPANNHLDNLEWMTPKENIHYCMLAGRHLNNRTKKLTADMRKEILELRRQGWSTPKLARKFNVSQACIMQFVSGRSYRLDSL